MCGHSLTRADRVDFKKLRFFMILRLSCGTYFRVPKTFNPYLDKKQFCYEQSSFNEHVGLKHDFVRIFHFPRLAYSVFNLCRIILFCQRINNVISCYCL